MSQAAVGLWSGMVVMVASAVCGVVTLGSGLAFKLSMLGIACGIGLISWGARRPD